MEELITTLEEEQQIYNELIPISEQKTKVIVSNDLQALQSITEKEQLAIDRINALEHKREGVIVNIGTVINRDPSTLKLKVIIDLLGKQPEEQKKLCKIHDHLNSTIQRLMQINHHNKSLIEQSLEMIEFNMNFIQSTRMLPGTNNYNKGAAAMDPAISQTGMFDAKQ